MSPVVRFAPSPTGRIHIGNARTALLNYLFAKSQGGTFVLRFDDTDLERSREEYAVSIEEDLRWLGALPDVIVKQSQRFDLYDRATQLLKDKGLLYPAYESADELDRKRKRQQARGLPPVYDRSALSLTAEDIAKLEAEGRRPHWRFKLTHEVLNWNDGIRGPSHIDTASLSDPVLIREDGTYLYTLPSVVDDIDLKITHVIRGEDHVTNTAVQVQLFQALGAVAPIFAHHNLLMSASGEGLSKRTGALSIAGLRESGVEALAVASLAVLTGSSDAVTAVPSLDALMARVDLTHISRNPAKFDPAELETLTARTLHELSFESVEARLAARSVSGAQAPAFWAAVRGNLTRFEDVDIWWAVVAGDISPIVEDAAFLAQAAALLPEGDFDSTTWSAWTKAVKEQTGAKGRGLFHPLRLALTGKEQGPELAALLPLIGRVKAVARLS